MELIVLDTSLKMLSVLEYFEFAYMDGAVFRLW